MLKYVTFCENIFSLKNMAAMSEIWKFDIDGALFALGNVNIIKSDTLRNILDPMKKSFQGGAWSLVLNAKVHSHRLNLFILAWVRGKYRLHETEPKLWTNAFIASSPKLNQNNLRTHTENKNYIIPVNGNSDDTGPSLYENIYCDFVIRCLILVSSVIAAKV